MGDAELQSQFQELRREVNDRMSKFETGMAKMEAEVRVTKHDVAGISQAQIGFIARVDKFQDAIGSKIDGLTERLSTLNLAQTRGAGFFAGIAASITVCLALLGLLAKFLAER